MHSPELTILNLYDLKGEAYAFHTAVERLVKRVEAEGDPGAILGAAALRMIEDPADPIRVGRCPKCDGVLRTPRARQCLHCNYDWH